MLMYESFSNVPDLVDFINNNKIKREDILKIFANSYIGIVLVYYSNS